jgi:hypothetical protein
LRDLERAGIIGIPQQIPRLPKFDSKGANA